LFFFPASVNFSPSLSSPPSLDSWPFSPSNWCSYFFRVVRIFPPPLVEPSSDFEPFVIYKLNGFRFQVEVFAPIGLVVPFFPELFPIDLRPTRFLINLFFFNTLPSIDDPFPVASSVRLPPVPRKASSSSVFPSHRVFDPLDICFIGPTPSFLKIKRWSCCEPLPFLRCLVLFVFFL